MLGHVYVRPELLYFEQQRVHLASNTEHRVTPADAALIELVYRGESELGVLSERIASCVPGATPEVVAEQVRASCSDPRSILEWRKPVPLVHPEVIVCDFSEEPTIADGRALARELRRQHRVLLLGLDARVRGDERANVGFARTKRAGHHQSWFEFLQWCRGVVRANPQALVVLCGQQDAILFGDLVDRVPTVVLASPSWPSVTGPAELLGAGWLPADPMPCVRALFYALLFHPATEWSALKRGAASDFAILEGFALRHAATVCYGSVDQAAALTRLGRDAATSHCGHGAAWPKPRQRLDGAAPDCLVLVAGLEGGSQPLVRYLRLLRTVPERPFRDVLVATNDGWFVLRDRDGGAELVPMSPPPPERCLAALVFPGLLRRVAPAFDVMALGIPTRIVPSSQPHPLQDAAPPSLWLRESSPATLAAFFARVADPADKFAIELRAAQATMVRDHSIVARVRSSLQPSAPGSGA